MEHAAFALLWLLGEGNVEENSHRYISQDVDNLQDTVQDMAMILKMQGYMVTLHCRLEACIVWQSKAAWSVDSWHHHVIPYAFMA